MDNAEPQHSILPHSFDSLYATAFSNMDQGFCLLEKVHTAPDDTPDFRYLLTNPAFQTHTGLHDVVGKTIRQMVPLVDQSTMEFYHQAALSGESTQFQAYVAPLNRWFEVSAFRISQQPVQLAVVFTNITRRKGLEEDRQQRQQRQRFLLELSDDMRAQANEEAIGLLCTSRLAEHLHLDRCYLAKLDAEQDWVQVGPEYRRADLKAVSGAYRLSDFPEVVRRVQTQTVVIGDVAGDPDLTSADKTALGAMDIGAFTTAVVRKGQEKVLWAVIVISTKPRAWTQSEVTFLEEVTERAWAATERAKAEEALRESEEKYRTLFASMNEGLAINEVIRDEGGRVVDARYLDLNPAYERHTGLERSSALGRLASEVFPHYFPHWLERVERVLTSGQPERFEHFVADTGRWFAFQLTPFGGTGGFTVFCDDITERKQAEVALKAERTWLHDIFMQAPAIIGLLTGPDHVFELANPLYMQLVGRVGKDRHILGMTVREALPEVTDQGFFELLDQVYQTGQPFMGNEMPVKVARNGHQQLGDVYLNFVYYPYRDAAGTVAGIFVHAVEVTEQVTARKLIQQSEERQTFLLNLSDALRPLVDSVEIENLTAQLVGEYFEVANAHYAQVVSEANEDYLVVHRGYVAPGARSLAGRYRLSDFPGVGAERFAAHTLIVDRVADDGRLTEKERASCVAIGIGAFMIVPLLNRGRLVAQLSLYNPAPRTWTQGEAQFLEGIAERTRDALERARAEVALKQADRRKDEFLAMLAHELRNPMATLHNTLLLLMLTKGADESLPLDSALAMMSREVVHLNRMVDDLLDVSRISQGKIQLRKERIDLTKLVSDALKASRPEFTRREQVLLASLAPGPVWVEGDDTRLTQVVRNLLTNAAKYTPNGGRIEVILTQQEQQAILRVVDTGIGLAADQLNSIFEVFVQVSTSLDRPQGGLGLGLAVVKQLVELHGGSVGVESAGLGKGSAFMIKLPTLANVQASGDQPADLAFSSPARPRILVVDDNADLALTTTLLLKHKKYEAYSCLSGVEALAAVEQLHPALVLLDLGMPGMDGYETCRRLRALPWGKQGLIVALSGYGQEEDKRRTQASGFDGHLMKPINLTLLTEVLTRLLKPAR